MKTFVFPFTAVVGQEQAKKALCIALVNPLTGGLLLSGSSGTAKSVLVRAAGQFTPVGQVVELPLSATEDMIFGSVDVEVAMRSGKRRLREGLLYRAEGRILYMDEVNLLRPDFLLAVLDSQQNGFFSLQREGMDICRSVSYIPVATMNPTEGTLEPAVLDRFGMFVSFDDEKSVSMRKEIICRVLSFEKNPQGFFKKYMQEQRQLQTNVERAKKILPQIELSLPMMQLAARICMQAFCQGNRAELYLIEAARALAALAQRTYVLPQDIEAAALYVLPHRMGSCNKQGLNPPERTPEQQNDLPDRDGDMETEELQPPDMTIEVVDALSGADFERFAAALYQKQGMEVMITPGSNDYGADVIVHSGEKYGLLIQCKHAENPLKAMAPNGVQEVLASLEVYKKRNNRQ